MALKYKFDLSRYAGLGYPGEVLRQIRLSKKDDIDISFLLKTTIMRAS